MAFVTTTVVFAGFGLILGRQREDVDTGLVLPLAGVGAVLALGSLFGARRLANLAVPYYLIRWAFAEAVGLLGFVLALQGEPPARFLPFIGAAAALILLAGPSEDEIREFPTPPRPPTTG